MKAAILFGFFMLFGNGNYIKQFGNIFTSLYNTYPRPIKVIQCTGIMDEGFNNKVQALPELEEVKVTK